MKKIYNLIIFFFVFLFILGIVHSADWTPQGDINLRETYQIKNATNISAQNLFGDGSGITNVNSNSTTWWNYVSGWISSWFYKSGNNLAFNDTLLNQTIANEGNRIGFNSTYNETYDRWSYNQSSPYDIFNYNMSDGSYNSTYNVWSYNQTLPLMIWNYNQSSPYDIYNYNMSDGSYNATYDSGIIWFYNQSGFYYYNQTIGSINLLNNTYGKFWYNQSSPYDSFNYNQTEGSRNMSGTVYLDNLEVGNVTIFSAPSECPSGYAMTFFNGTNSICIDSWVNENGDIMTGNLTIYGDGLLLMLGNDSATFDSYIGFNNLRGFVGYDSGTMTIQSGVDKGISMRVSTNVFGSGGTEAMKILKDGKIGIKSSTPSYNLEVNGDVNISNNVFINGTNVGIKTSTALIDLAIGDSDTGLEQVSDGELAIYTQNNERVRIDSSGRVGIGTNDPSSLLELSGGNLDMNSGFIREAIMWVPLYDGSSLYNNFYPAFSDTLYYGNYRDISITSNRALSGGSLNNVFNLNNNNFANWASVSSTNPVWINISYGSTWSSGKGPYLNDFEIIFSWRQENAINYTIDVLEDANDDGIYSLTRKCTVTNNDDYIEICNIKNWRVKEIYMNVSAAGDGDRAGYLRIGTFQAKSSNNGDATGHLAGREENTFYGNQNINVGDLYLDEADNEKYILFRNSTTNVFGISVLANKNSMYFSRFNDAGSWIGSVISLTRSNGFVGINITAPTHQLTVVGDTNTTGNLISGNHTPQSSSFSIGSSTLRWFKGWFSGLDVSGNINQTNGNATINNIYGGMWYSNYTATSLNFAVDGQFYYLFFTDATHLNGFGTEGLGFMSASNNLTAQVSGVYQANYMATGDGQNNHVYHTSIFVNDVNQLNCDTQHKLAAGGDILTQTGTCLIDLSVGDKISLKTADIGGTGTGNYYGANLDLVRVGN